MKKFRYIFCAILLLIVTACGSGLSEENPVLSKEVIFSTKTDQKVEITGGTAIESESDVYRTIEPLGVVSSGDNAKELLFRELTNSGTNIIRGNLTKEEELVPDRFVNYGVINSKNDILLLYNETNGNWVLTKNGVTKFSDRIDQFFKGIENELIFSSRKNDQYIVYFNDEEIWESPKKIFEYIIHPNKKAYAAVVQGSQPEKFRVTSSKNPDDREEYQQVEELQFFGETIVFLAKKNDEWFWVSDGERSKIPYIIKQIKGIVEYKEGLFTVVKIQGGTADAQNEQWVLLDQEGKIKPLPEGPPTRPVATSRGVKTIIKSEPFKIYNATSGKVEKEGDYFELILLNNGEDIWYAEKVKNNGLVKVYRGNFLLGEFVSYKAVKNSAGRDIIITEQSNGDVEIISITP